VLESVFGKSRWKRCGSVWLMWMLEHNRGRGGGIGGFSWASDLGLSAE